MGGEGAGVTDASGQRGESGKRRKRIRASEKKKRRRKKSRLGRGFGGGKKRCGGVSKAERGDTSFVGGRRNGDR